MAINPCKPLPDREFDKFAEDANGDICVRTCGELSITGSRALSQRYSSVSIDDSSWTSITGAFTGILVLSVQNNSGVEIKLNAEQPVGYVGMPLKANRERNYNDLDTGFVLYAKSSSGTVDIDVEVLRNVS